MEYELYHYGVKGMRWGVRRYQNMDGSLTDIGRKKLEKWRTKESDKITKKYQVDKLNKVRDRLEEQFFTKGGAFIENRLTKARYRALKASGMEYLEKSKLQAMTYQDMLSERSELRKARGKSFITSLGRDVIDSDVFKTNRRVSLEESMYNEYEVRKATGYRGL